MLHKIYFVRFQNVICIYICNLNSIDNEGDGGVPSKASDALRRGAVDDFLGLLENPKLSEVLAQVSNWRILV